MYQCTVKATLLASAFILTAAGSASAADEDHISFKMVAANPCLPDAKAKEADNEEGGREQCPRQAPYGCNWRSGP